MTTKFETNIKSSYCPTFSGSAKKNKKLYIYEVNEITKVVQLFEFSENQWFWFFEKKSESKNC
jgi:hypothetical protein